MSVRIIRNEKARSTTIWQFFAVAILPLLMAYFGGFSAGKTLKVDSVASQSKIDSMQLHIKALQDSLRSNEQIIDRLYEMQKNIQEEVYSLGDEIEQAFLETTPDNGDPGRDVMQKIEDFFRERKDTLFDLKNRLKDQKLYSNTSDKLFLLADKILSLQKAKLEDKKHNLRTGVISDDISKCGEEKEQLEDQIRNLNFDLRVKDSQLDACKNKDVGNNQASNNTLKVVSQSKEFAKEITKEVEDIRKNILPELKSGLLGNPKQIEKIKQRIQASVDGIGNKASNIITL